jgi:hypothetical protein
MPCPRAFWPILYVFSVAAANAQNNPASTVPVAATGAQVSGEARTQPPSLQPQPSSLATYRRFDADAVLVDWRQANDTVLAIGGWRAYAREAAKANAATTTPPKAAATPAAPAVKPRSPARAESQ